MSISIEPLREREPLRAYIDEHWRRGHVLARDERMTEFTYATPWVDRTVFPAGYSVLGAYDEDDHLVGFLGSIATPYPRPRSYWLALWHVLPDLKGGGLGGKLLRRMQEIAVEADGWIGTFGAGPEALPVYFARGYLARAVRRWVMDAEVPTEPPPTVPPNPSPREIEPPADWLEYRYDRHPIFTYERHAGGIFRTEENDWGRVTHAAWLPRDSSDLTLEVYEREHAVAKAAGRPYVLDAWSIGAPGPRWQLAPRDLPSVFHPPEPRGNTIFTVGFPFLPDRVQKGDCDQDRPN